MCNICNKSKCCCIKTVSVTGPRGPKGEKGSPGINGRDGAGVYDVRELGLQAENVSLNYNTNAVSDSADYLVTICAYLEVVGMGQIAITTRALKNGVLNTSNSNYEYIVDSTSQKLTYTHSFKISLSSGDTTGFQIVNSATTKLNKGTIVVSKINN